MHILIDKLEDDFLDETKKAVNKVIDESAKNLIEEWLEQTYLRVNTDLSVMLVHENSNASMQSIDVIQDLIEQIDGGHGWVTPRNIRILASSLDSFSSRLKEKADEVQAEGE